MYVYDLETDTGGLSFPTAVQQMFVGVYFLELCLTGLFFLVRNADGNGVPCKVQGILMIILLVLTILFQALVYHSVCLVVYCLVLANDIQFHPLVTHLPLDRSLSAADDTVPLLTEETRTSRQITPNAQKTREELCTYREDLEGKVDQDGIATTPTTLDDHERDALVLEAFKHEALRRRTPIIWLPEDALGIAADEVRNMPANVPASTRGAILNERGVAEYGYGCDPPDYVRHDDTLL